MMVFLHFGPVLSE